MSGAQIDALISAATVEGTVSVWLADLDGRVAVDRGASVAHYAASTMKVPVVVAAYRLHEQGALDLDQEVEVHNALTSAADGSHFSLDQNGDQDDDTWAQLSGRRSLRLLAEHALTRSGNLATNLVLEQVRAALHEDEVARVLAEAGCSDSTVIRRGIEDLAAARAGINNLVTAEDLGRVLLGVANRTLAGKASCAEVEAVLVRQEHRDGIPAGLPEGTYVANKTGWVEGICHDMAIVRPDGRPPYVLVILSTTDLAEPDGQRLIAGLSRIVWEGT